MEFNQVRYFIALARTLHFTKAAEACHVSQPALTRAIQKLEQEFGGPLFYRERNHTQLTELGRLMLPSLERALDAARDAKQQAEVFQRRETSPLRIGLEHSVPAAELTPVFAALRRHSEEFDLSLDQGTQTVLCERLLAGDLDVALLVDGPEFSERLNRWALFDERYVLICPPDHRFADRPRVSVPDIAAEYLLLHEDPDCRVRRFVEALFEAHGVKPRRERFGATQEQIVEMVLASLGVSVVGERLPALSRLLARSIEADADRRTVMLATVAGRPFGPTPALFVKLMRARSWMPAETETDIDVPDATTRMRTRT